MYNYNLNSIMNVTADTKILAQIFFLYVYVSFNSEGVTAADLQRLYLESGDVPTVHKEQRLQLYLSSEPLWYTSRGPQVKCIAPHIVNRNHFLFTPPALRLFLGLLELL